MNRRSHTRPVATGIPACDQVRIALTFPIGLVIPLALALIGAGAGCLRPETSGRPTAKGSPVSPLSAPPTSAHADADRGDPTSAEGAPARAAHRFEDPEEWTRHLDDPERTAWQKPEEVVAMMGLYPGMVVADIGAGTGYFIPHLSRAVGETGRVLALDVEEEMVRYMDTLVENEEIINVKPRAVPPDDPSLPPAGVDRVLIVNTWHHIADRVTYAGKIAEGLAPAGTVWIVDFTKESPMGPPPSERVSPETVVAELSAGGLAAESVPSDLPYQYVVVGRRR